LGCCQRIVCQYLETIEELDKAITDFSTKLSSYNPEAAGNEKYLNATLGHFCYNALLFGKLVLSDFTKNALAQFKSKIE
jgi:methylglutaconyl-CoA hydratase